MYRPNLTVITLMLASVWATAGCGTHPAINPLAPEVNSSTSCSSTTFSASSAARALSTTSACSERSPGETTVISQNAQCTIQGFGTARRSGPPPAVVAQLVPDGVLRVGVNYGNPNNASRDGSGALHGVAIDLACVIAADLEADVAFTAYAGIPTLLQGFDRREWILGFTAMAPNLATAHPHIGVDNTYLVPASSPFQAVADVDRAGVRVSVAQGNATDLYLTSHLQSAALVRFPTVPDALAAVQQGAVQAFAGARDTALGFLSQMPSGRVLPDNFATFYLGMNVGPDRPDALAYLNAFVERAKRSGLIQEVINRAGLTGVTIP
jgi:polar amino acid transport system substrate-binding protein